MNDIYLPREKMLAFGPEKLSDAELVAILLRTGTCNKNVVDLATEVLNLIGGIHQLTQINYDQLAEIKGMKQAKCSTLLAVHELLCRILTPQPGEKIQLH